MRGSDDEDFVAYVTGRLPVLRRLATHLAGDAHRGDDLVQTAVTRLYLHWRRASRTENLDGYVFKILLRAFLDERRLRWAAVRLGTAPTARDPGADAASPAADHASTVADRLVLRQALATLPPKQRAVLALRFLADRSVDEVARILEIAPGTVKSQTHDGLNALRRLLGQPEVTDSELGARP
ncbi:MAG TPA: SigE family RNA polymerase sigma factor [Micromonosporaceae bacterium]